MTRTLSSFFTERLFLLLSGVPVTAKYPMETLGLICLDGEETLEKYFQKILSSIMHDALKREREEDYQLAKMLVEHLQSLNLDSQMIPVELDGKKFMVTVERKE